MDICSLQLHRYFQEIVLPQTLLITGLEAMYYTLYENIAFNKYESLMELIARVSDSQKKKEDLPGNANLRSQRIKSELIQALGKQIVAI